MKKIVVLLLLAFVGAAGWSVGNQLSSDALGMSVGILLGVLAGLPVALLVIAAGRRSERYEPDPDPRYYPQQQPQAPVIMLMGNGQQVQPGQWQQGQYPGQQQQYLPGPGQAGQWHSAPASSYDFWDGDQATEDW